MNTVTTLSKQELAQVQQDPFYLRYKGSFSGVLRWPQLDDLWELVVADKDTGWFIYAVGEAPPEEASDGESVERFIHEVDQLLRREHDEDYCGIVYADNRMEPGFIKIYDPNHLGTSCGSSGISPMPGWILSKLKPVDLPSAFPQPGNRKRWWKSLFG